MDYLEDVLYRKGFPLLGELAFWDLYSEISDKGHSGSEKDKPPNKGQAESTPVYTLYRKSPLKEYNLSTKDKTAGPEKVLHPLRVLYRTPHCSALFGQIVNIP